MTRSAKQVSFRPKPSKRLPTVCVLLCAAIVTALSGCLAEPSPSARLLDYHQRLVRLLEPDVVPQPPPVDLPALPSKTASQLPLTEQRTGLLDMLQLSQCNLAQLVAERNSSLGKLQAPSLRLSYEIRLLDGLRDCLGRLNRDDALYHRFAPVYQIKQQEILTVFANSLLASDELRANFTRSAPPWLPGSPSVGTSLQALADLNLVARQLAQQQPISQFQLQTIEPALHTLYRQQSGAALLVSTSQALAGLVQVNRLLTQALTDFSCLQQRAQYLDNVFKRYYIAAIQPLLAQIYQQQQQWEQALSQLFAELPLSDAATRLLSYYQPDTQQQLSRQLQQATVEHAKLWGRIADQCQIPVGQSRA